MTYYGYEFIRESDLTHHGILGQKWGVRRFQNKDGTRTSAGKSRYKKGKEYSREKSKLSRDEYKRLIEKNSEKLKALQDEAFNIAKKYGLDMDDGGGGDSEKYSEEELREAGRKYMQLWDDIEIITSRCEDEGREYADSVLKSKYGDQAISDIEYYHKTKAFAAVASIEGVILLSLLAVVNN